MRVAAWVILVAVAGAAGRAHASAASCLPQCDLQHPKTVSCCSAEPCFAAPCGDYLGCVAGAKSWLQSCYQTSDTCQPTSAGRCTIILGCVRKCQARYRVIVRQCAIDAFKALPCGAGCTLSARGQHLAVKACNACNPPPPTTSTVTTTTVASTSTTATRTTTTRSSVTTTTSGGGGGEGYDCAPLGLDRCTADCLHRIGALRGCYGDCVDRCSGNLCAKRLCQQGCRNSLCEAIKARCSSGSVQEADPEYLTCCGFGTANDTCLGRDELPCKIVTTTTSTSSTSSTTATPTTTLTTTTTSPQPG